MQVLHRIESANAAASREAATRTVQAQTGLAALRACFGVLLVAPDGPEALCEPIYDLSVALLVFVFVVLAQLRTAQAEGNLPDTHASAALHEPHDVQSALRQLGCHNVLSQLR